MGVVVGRAKAAGRWNVFINGGDTALRRIPVVSSGSLTASFANVVR